MCFFQPYFLPTLSSPLLKPKLNVSLVTKLYIILRFTHRTSKIIPLATKFQSVSVLTHRVQFVTNHEWKLIWGVPRFQGIWGVLISRVKSSKRCVWQEDLALSWRTFNIWRQLTGQLNYLFVTLQRLPTDFNR